MIVAVVVVALADLPDQDRPGPGLYGKIVVEALRDVDALPRYKADLRPRRYRQAAAVARNGDVRASIHALIRQREVDPEQQDAAPAVDDVLRFEPVKMPGRVLPLF